MVPGAGLEPAQLSPLPPQDSVSTNFTTRATTLLEIGECIVLPTLCSTFAGRFGIGRSRFGSGLLNLRNARLTSNLRSLFREHREREACYKKHDSEQSSGTGQKAATALAAKHRLGGATAECRTGVRTLTLLDQHKTHKANGDDNVYDDNQCLPNP